MTRERGVLVSGEQASMRVVARCLPVQAAVGVNDRAPCKRIARERDPTVVAPPAARK